MGLEPQPAPPHVFALDGRQLRYGGFGHTAGGLSFDTYRVVDLPPGLFADGPLGGPVRDVTAWRELVADFVAGLGESVREASLVLPDTWLRLLFTEIEELPSKSVQQEEIVRFKLRRLVPFRLEDLRVSFAEVRPLPGQQMPLRLLVGFAIEVLVAQIEDAFSAAGSHLGQVTNSSLAVLAALGRKVGPDALAALVMVDRDTYTVSYVQHGEPLLYRFKALGELPPEALESVVRRDLHLTRTFVEQHRPDTSLARLVLAADPEVAPAIWTAWLEHELGVRAEAMGLEHLPLVRPRTDLPWQEAAILAGGAAAEVT